MRFIKGLVGIILGVVALVAVTLFLLPSEKIAKLAGDQIRAQTGRDLVITGDVTPTVWPTLGVRMEGVSFSNAPWSEQPNMLTAERLSVGVDFASLFRGDLKIREVVLVRPNILLERNAQGQANWELGSSYAPQAQRQSQSQALQSTPARQSVSTSRVFLPTLDSATITDGTLTIVDVPSDMFEKVSAVDAQIAFPDAQGPLTLNGSVLYRGAAVSFNGQLSDLAKGLSGQLSDLDMTFEIGGTSLSLKGQGSILPAAYKGRVDLVSRERQQLFQALGQPSTPLPEGLGRDLISLGGDLTVTEQNTLHLRSMTLTLDRNEIKGALDVDANGTRPKIVANLAAEKLDLKGLSQQGRGGAQDAAPEGWSTEKIDVSALQLVDLELLLNSGPVSLGDANLERVSAKTILTSGRAVTTLNPVAFYGGALTGEVIVNSRGGLSSRVNLRLQDLQLKPLLTEFIDFERLSSTANGQINVLLVGDSLDALMRSLDGQGAFSLGSGRIEGVDFAGMLQNLGASFEERDKDTVFDSATASFSFKEGVMTNQDLRFMSPIFTATGAGTVDIGAQTVNYRVTPEAILEGTRGIKVPVLIRGPWWNLSYRPDLENLFDQKLEDEKKALEAKARAELAKAQAEAQAKAKAAQEEAKRRAQERLAQELEVDAGTLDSREAVEDAIEERLKNEINDALGGIFGR